MSEKEFLDNREKYFWNILKTSVFNFKNARDICKKYEEENGLTYDVKQRFDYPNDAGAYMERLRAEQEKLKNNEELDTTFSEEEIRFANEVMRLEMGDDVEITILYLLDIAKRHNTNPYQNMTITLRGINNILEELTKDIYVWINECENSEETEDETIDERLDEFIEDLLSFENIVDTIEILKTLKKEKGQEMNFETIINKCKEKAKELKTDFEKETGVVGTIKKEVKETFKTAKARYSDMKKSCDGECCCDKGQNIERVELEHLKKLREEVRRFEDKPTDMLTVKEALTLEKYKVLLHKYMQKEDFDPDFLN